MALRTTAQPIPSRRVAAALIGRLARLLRGPFAIARQTPSPAPQAVARISCASSRIFSIVPGGVYELRLLIFVDAPAHCRILPIEGRLTFLKVNGEKIPAQTDGHAYRAGDLSRFVVEGFGAALAEHEIDDLLVAHRYFVAPPYARQVRVEFVAATSFHIGWCECEQLVAKWVREAGRVGLNLREHYRARLTALSPILSETDERCGQADVMELTRIAATELEQISIVTSLWSFLFNWSPVCAECRIESAVCAFSRLAEHTEERPAIAFVGGERLYSKLSAHFLVILPEEDEAEDPFDLLEVTALIIESAVESLNADWYQVWCDHDAHGIGSAGRALLDAARRRRLPIIFYYTAEPGRISFFGEMFKLADRIFVEGVPDACAEDLLARAPGRIEFVPRTFERFFARPAQKGASGGYGILLPVRSESLRSPQLWCAIAGLPPKATLITLLGDEVGGQAATPPQLERYRLLRIASYHEFLHLCREAAVTVLVEHSLDRGHQQDIALDAIGSGAVVVFMGDPHGLNEITRYVVRVGDPTELSEQVRLLANGPYREQVWLSSYREICRAHSFDSVIDRLHSCGHLLIPSNLAGEGVLAPAHLVQYS